MIKTVFFDMDGVLLDSLQAHLDFYKYMACILDVDAVIVDVDTYKNEYARKHVKISPMVEFFRAMGFGDKSEEATYYYVRDFPGIRVPMFEGIEEQLGLLSRSRTWPIGFGIVTANVTRAVYSGLANVMELFPAYSVYAHDMLPAQHTFSKVWALKNAAYQTGLKAEEILYVGDQFSDAIAAEQAGCPFLGVSYGWAFADSDERPDFPLVKSPGDLARDILIEVEKRK